MRKLIVAAMVVAAVATAAGGLAKTATAAGFAGSQYGRSQCTYSKTSNVLYCERTFTVSTPNATQITPVSDATCESGTRIIVRTGTIVDTFLAWERFTGHVPHAGNLIEANEVQIGETWADFTDVDQGCLV